MKYKKLIRKKVFYVVFIAALIILFSTIGIITMTSSDKKISKNTNKTIIVKPSQKITSVLSASPSATVIPTPTKIPVIPLGFCLKVPVIFYHHIEPLSQAKAEGHQALTVDSEIFTKQMNYLVSSGYTSYSAEQLADALISHTFLPGKPVVVTIDDGYLDAYQFAYPIAKKYGIKLSLMIATGLLENSGYLSWNNLKEMVAGGTVFAYDHTWSHYSLPRGTYDKERYEIMTARKQLEDHLGNPNLIFAYPYGASNSLTVSILKKEGFKGAFTTIPSFLQCDGYIYNLHRNRIGNAMLASYGL